MFLNFKKTEASTTHQNVLLEDDELINLRLLSEQVDCSVAPNVKSNSRQAGSLATRLLGSGTDYAESRIYQAGDDPRSINWRLSARSTETFVKTYHIESRPSLTIFLDKRRSMVFGTKRRLKVEQAVRTAVLLTYASEQHQINFQAWIVDDEGTYHFDDVNDFLLKANKACLPITNQTMAINNCTPIKIESVMPDLIQRVTEGSLVYFISDLTDFDNPQTQANIALLHEKSFVQVLHIIDDAELSLSKLGKVQFQDMTESTNYRLDTKKKKDRSTFLDHAENLAKRKKALISDLGISYARLFTHDEAIQTQIILPLGHA